MHSPDASFAGIGSEMSSTSPNFISTTHFTSDARPSNPARGTRPNLVRLQCNVVCSFSQFPKLATLLCLCPVQYSRYIPTPKITGSRCRHGQITCCVLVCILDCPVITADCFLHGYIFGFENATYSLGRPLALVSLAKYPLSLPLSGQSSHCVGIVCTYKQYLDVRDSAALVSTETPFSQS